MPRKSQPLICSRATDYPEVGSQLTRTGLPMNWLPVVKKEDFRKADH